MSITDTIFALATPPAKSGVAILRLSGRQALPCLQQLCRLTSVTARHAHYASFFDPATGECIDRGLALYFRAPYSFTGEDVVELHTHGSLAVIRHLQRVLAAMPGLRVAEPGEFTRRAFLNGRMDLMEAEGLADLIDAETRQQQSQALRQMQGELSAFYHQLRSSVLQCLAHLEAYIDFPDEDIPESVLEGLGAQIASLQQSIVSALADDRRGERLRDGIAIAILGAPNAGKSSLLNRIARRDAAIVSQRAGTTRDIIEIHLDMGGWPVLLIDTAGIRDSEDEIEREGIRRALERAGQADIKLILFDGSAWPSIDASSQTLLDDKAIAVVSKSDLVEGGNRISHDAIPGPHFISTRTGEGVEALLDALQARITEGFSGGEGARITRQRHRAMLEHALQSFEKAQQPLPLELICEELRQAAQAIGKITGQIQVDDVLDVIFRQFCIGK